MRKGAARTRFLIMCGIAALFVGILIVAPFFIPFDVNSTDLSASLIPPGAPGFLFGSDALGRNVFARTLAGGAESVGMGIGVLAMVVLIGCVVGLVAGWSGGIVDAVLSKIITAFQAFPGFVLAVALAGVLGQGMLNMVIALTAVYWTQFARLVRSIVQQAKGSESINAARMCGVPPYVLVTRHLLPEIAGPVAVLAAVSLSDIILTMAGLSFIGLGPSRPTNEWGAMMAEAQPLFQYALWCMLVPMVALFLAVVIFNFLGDTLRDALDVRTQYLPRRLARKQRTLLEDRGVHKGVKVSFRVTGVD